ncbi:MAG: glycosyltransferase family 39 protein [Cyanobacteria bacterium J06639_14]
MHSFVLHRYWLVLAVLIGLRVVFGLGAFPNPDEAYYWLWGQHLDWSYFDHPPFHAWIQGLFTKVLGRSHFVLRLPTVISSGLLLWLYSKICGRLYGRQANHAFWLTLLLLLTSPLLFLFLAMAWHDHWLIVFGLAASFCLIRFLSGDRLEDYPWLYGAGILIGLAALCKYVALFLGLGFLAAIGSEARWRSLLKNGHLYGAIALALLVTTPIFWWNAQHDFASFQFYLGRSVQAESPTPIQWFGPIGFGLLSILIFGPIHTGVLVKAAFQEPATYFGTTYRRVAFAVFAVSTIGLGVLSLKVPVLYYWNILAYPLLLPLMAGIFLNPYRSADLRHRWWLRGTAGLGLVVAILLVAHYTLFPWSALAGETGDEDTRMLYGWSQVAEQVQQAAATFPMAPLLLTTDYRSAAALAYVLQDATVMSVSGRIDQFDFWYDAIALDGKDAVLVGDRWHPICPAHLQMFDRTDPAETIAVKRFGIFIKDYMLVRGYGFQTNGANADPLSSDYPLAFTSDGEICAGESS